MDSWGYIIYIPGFWLLKCYWQTTYLGSSKLHQPRSRRCCHLVASLKLKTYLLPADCAGIIHHCHIVSRMERSRIPRSIERILVIPMLRFLPERIRSGVGHSPNDQPHVMFVCEAKASYWAICPDNFQR